MSKKRSFKVESDSREYIELSVASSTLQSKIDMRIQFWLLQDAEGDGYSVHMTVSNSERKRLHGLTLKSPTSPGTGEPSIHLNY